MAETAVEKNDFKTQKLIEANILMAKTRWFYYFAMILTGPISKLTPGMNANANFSPQTMIAIALPGLFFNIYTSWFYDKMRTQKCDYQRLKRITYFQFIFEQLIITTIIFFAGGLSSISFLYYFYSIIASAFFFHIAETAFITSTAALMYVFLILGQFFDVLPYHSRYNTIFEETLIHNPSAIITNLWAVVTSLYIVGAFSAILSKMLKEKEAENLAEKEKSSIIVKNLSDGLIFSNSRGVIEIVNPRAEALLDVKASDIVGRRHEEITPNTPVLFQVINSTGRITITPFGKAEQTYDINNMPLRDVENRLVGQVRIVHDISREKFIDRIKSEFVTIAGHQLRTPLSAIKSAVDLLRNGDYGPVNDEQASILKKTFEYTNHLINIVNDLLNVSSLEQGRYDYRYQEADITLLLKEIIQRFSDTAEKKNIRLFLNIGEEMSLVELDSYKIKLALSGIVNNALSYSPKGGLVTIEARVDKDKAFITCEDNGIGIPQIEQEKIFSKFFRAQNSLKVKTDGNGLDLFVAKNIIENHGGRIWFESIEGRGTKFFVELPVRQPKNKTNI